MGRQQITLWSERFPHIKSVLHSKFAAEPPAKVLLLAIE